MTYGEILLSLIEKYLPDLRGGHVGEYRFHAKRQWRFDHAWPEIKLAVEIEGGVFTRGRHTSGKGFIADCEKYNTAAALGWLVVRVPGHLITEKPGKVVDWIEAAVDRAKLVCIAEENFVEEGNL